MHTTPLSPEDPAELGGFELLGRIGHGGMGQVFLGESQGGEPAAVKVIKPTVVDSESRQRFAQEIEILKTVWGPRIAAFLGADAEAEQPWLATEYVDGPDLGKHVATHGPLPSLLVASLGATLAEALASVHTQGLLHRDLKPANILLGPNGPKVIDFGLAVFAESNVSLTAPNQVVGTPVCMAPEQAAGVKPLTGAVDVYALGALLLLAATEHYPYQGATPFVVFHQTTDPNTLPDLNGLPAELTPLLTAMLAQDPKDRPALSEVVSRCRAVIEAQGMKVAQARRKLTAYTASTAPQNVAPEPLPAPTVPPTVPFADLRTIAAVEPAPQLPEPTVEWPTPTTQEPQPQSQAAPPAPGARRRAPAPRTLRHSAQARRTAEQLRKAYAAKTPF
ncbi:protein kinase [Streptomyces clavifer]|uniref:serine/threonine-protein kinase n=1 Tax=Streptomyces TaxID=1883 RepID=UPI0006FAAD34|nr:MULTISPECIES: serine/threonine-protein kinase [unclassified Streptomyces]KQX85172.1 serine/threonine protein kinase [Streptomyces sp. Root1319]KQZ17200.1 serine/threonine protein kinase [Streptomyces sp. Root55]